ncbi:MAG: protein translocase subunit SecF [Anaerolineales bacterium]|jgi:preprotein translocase subunit SecF|nr:protein translocase subunit SecF [Chloroflexota bacterium]MBK6646146.1 protein translocase subunit SecF [Anaerolineales bacterium]MCC6985793.1 protein translocase subunit SecF [Anaerolineales bacterium]
MIDILSKRYLYFLLSFIIIVPGLVFLAVDGLPLSIDFTGGSLFEIAFETGQTLDTETINAIYEDAGIDDAQVTTTDTGSVLIRSSFLTNEVRDQILTGMKTAVGGEVTVISFDSVGPTIGAQVASRAALAVGVAALGVVFYITLAFRKVQNAFRYGVCAVIAMAHDVAVVFSIAGIGARFFEWQMDALFLTALLTVIGFSVQDKVVVFDRIRENATSLRRLEYETLVNHSIVQTLQRSINTQLMTVEFLLLSLALFGGVTLQEFAVILLVGLLSGTYSSIFVAAPILVLWEKREWSTWFGRGANA